jgi:hypothetical protein
MARDSDLDTCVIMIDGIEVAGQCLVAALVITPDGRKIPVGLYLGDTENATVVTNLQKHGPNLPQGSVGGFRGGGAPQPCFLHADGLLSDRIPR